MPKNLMWTCRNFETNGCNEVVKAVGKPYAEPDGEFGGFTCYGNEQEALDKKCESCPQGLFKMENGRCPICHDDLGIKRNKPEKANLGSESKPEWFYLFTCGEGHNLYNEKDILD